MSDDREPIDWVTCWDCGGEGFYIACPDDLCRGAGECMHGDGERACLFCKGTGEVPIYEENDNAD